jgi:cyclase
MTFPPPLSAWLVRGAACLFGLVGTWVAVSQTTPPPQPLATQKLKDDLFLVTGPAGNVLVYVTSEGLILVDDMYERQFDEILGQVRAISNLPIRYVLNTHHHDDHAGGNAKMQSAGAVVMQHAGARESTLKLNQPGAGTVTFNDELNLVLGGKQVRSRHFGRGHTNGDAVIYIPAHRLIHTGDLFLTNNPTRPYFDYSYGGSAVAWPQTLDGVLGTEWDIAVPGHGPVSDRAGVTKYRATVQKILDRVRGLVRSGKPKADVVKALVEEFEWPAQGLAIAQVDAFIDEVR